MMTGNEFAQYLLRLNLSVLEVAQLLSVNPRTIRRWLDGEEVSGPAEQAVRAWIRLHDRHLPWRPDSASILSDNQDRIARDRSHAITLDQLLSRAEARGGARVPWTVDWDRGTVVLGPVEVSFYKLLNGGFSLSSYRRTDGDPDIERDQEIIEDAALCIAQTLKKKDPGFGPVTLIIHDGPAKGRIAMQQLEDFPTARDAIRSVCRRAGSPGFHDPFITAKSSVELLWDTRDLLNECERRAKAPSALLALAGYVSAHAGMFVTQGPKMLSPKDAMQRKQRIECLAGEVRILADKARDGMTEYREFETILGALHQTGFFPEGQLVSDVAHALVRV